MENLVTMLIQGTKTTLFSAFLLFSSLHAGSQTLPDMPKLQEYRKHLAGIDSLMRKGILRDESSGLEYFTGYSYKTLYDWDQYFEALVQIYMGWPSFYIKNGVIIFLKNQKESGMISRSVPSNEWHDPEHIKPFLAQISWLVYKAYGEKDWILQEPYFTKLKKYIDFWLVDMDINKNGLSEWMSGPHTGMDNQHERAGFWLDWNCEGVDLNSYLVRECRAFPGWLHSQERKIWPGNMKQRLTQGLQKSGNCCGMTKTAFIMTARRIRIDPYQKPCGHTME